MNLLNSSFPKKQKKKTKTKKRQLLSSNNKLTILPTIKLNKLHN